MKNEDIKILFNEHSKRVDDRHDSLVTLITTEFERANSHLSKLNNRTAKIEDQTAFARFVQRNPVWSVIILITVLSLLIGLVEVTGFINVIRAI